jgi:Flp pilus assembly protein TadD
MKHHKIFLLITLIIIFINSCSKPQRIELCYEILKIDNNMDFKVSNDDYKLLDKIINKAESEIKVKKIYSKKEAIDILTKIYKIHESFGIRTPLRRYGEPLCVALNEKNFDCGNYVITYLSIAQRLKLPLFAVTAPQHIFLQWKDSDNSFYWETLYGRESFKEEYIKNHHIPEGCIANGTYLQPINKKQFFADYYNTLGVYVLPLTKESLKSFQCFKIAYNLDSLKPEVLSGIGDYYFRKQSYDSAIKYYNNSLNINKNYYSSYNNRGLVMMNLGNFIKAKNDFQEALNCTNDSVALSRTYYNLGKVYFMVKNYSEAKNYFDTSISLNNSNSFAYDDRGVCYLYSGIYDSALYNFNNAIKLEDNSSVYFNNRGIAHILLGDTNDAINDFHKALILDSTNKDALNNYKRLSK